ncbi:MAG: hypothetical protein CM15mP46_7320 [Alphaproteobacteria bacterium]|nr:MAG: hypothetical protein CM15mP46_7320 [Alphaproteobacteria bacterium]
MMGIPRYRGFSPGFLVDPDMSAALAFGAILAASIFGRPPPLPANRGKKWAPKTQPRPGGLLG